MTFFTSKRVRSRRVDASSTSALVRAGLIEELYVDTAGGDSAASHTGASTLADGHGEGPRRVDLDPAAYDEQWSALAATGADVHGEATLVEVLLDRPAARVLDAGCG